MGDRRSDAHREVLRPKLFAEIEALPTVDTHSPPETKLDLSVAAATARRLGARLLREAMAVRAELDLASYDRLFPAQDFVPKGSFGNLIALPVQGECRRRGNTVFLDPSTLEPWKDQWEFVSSVARRDD
jgi:hypothetical protein